MTKEKYTRVTSVLKTYKDFSKVDSQLLEYSADRGQRVHNFCELYMKNLLFFEVDKDCKPYFESFKKWYDEVINKVLFTEQRLYCVDYKITGQIDCVMTLIGETTPLILDLKTPKNDCKTWRLQTAAYQYLFNKNNRIKVPRRATLRLDKDGKTAKFNEYTSPHDEKLFFKALELHRFFRL